LHFKRDSIPRLRGVSQPTLARGRAKTLFTAASCSAPRLRPGFPARPIWSGRGSLR
jgi:hypothetical protein